MRAGPALALALALAATPAAAQFDTRDLTTVTVDTTGYGWDGDVVVRAEPERLTLGCMGCADFVAVDVLMERAPPGMDDNVRDGRLGESTVEGLCRLRNPECTARRRDAGRAVGFMTLWSMGDSRVATVQLNSGRDRLTIRSMADDERTAIANADRVIDTVGLAVIGR